MRAAIYARFSSENQHERSIDDQVRLCQEWVARHGGTVAGVYADYALSGAHLRSRPQALRLLDDARAGLFDTVIAEGLDRLSRDQEDIAAIHKRMGFAGVRIATVQEGDISELHVGLKGTMNALFLKDLAAKVRRGQQGRAIAGSVPAGLSYGYALVRELDARGELIRGKRRVDPDQAKAIRRIFEEYAAGLSPRAIAAGLNRDGIPSPSGGHWNASTINGSASRKNGILYNEAYIGILIYNRLTMVKDPETGKRISRPRPPAEWVVTEVPELRIVDDEIWNAVQAIKAGFAHMRVDKRRRAKHALSGLIRCGCCGGAYTVKSKDQLACSVHREAGTCANGRTIRMGDLERRVLDGIRTRLLSPRAVAVFVETYQAERRRLARESAGRRDEVKARLAKVERQCANIVDAIADGVASPTMKAKLRELEGERAHLAAEWAALTAEEGATVVSLHPAAVDLYRSRLDTLHSALSLAQDDEARAEAMAHLRALVARIEVHPGAERGVTELKVLGRIEELIGLARPGSGEAASGSRRRTAMMVAAEGFEPPTKGL
ncbi:recombinase family protein [Azospirillum sp. A39]